MDQTDVDCYFYRTIFEISHTQHRVARVSKRFNKKSFAENLFRFRILKKEQRYILQDDGIISKIKLSFLLDSLRIFLKVFL